MSTRDHRPPAAGESDWLTLGQAAKFLGVAQSTMRKWSDVGRVPAFYTPGGHRRYKRGDLEAFLERSGPGKPARGPLVLLVDDDPQVREVVRINLEMEGYTVREAGNAEDGLAALEDEAPDLILLDVMMPQVDGWEMLRRVGIRRKAVRPARSGRADEADRPRLISADRHLERWFVHHRAGWLDPIFEGLSYAGRLGLLWVVLALVLGGVYRRWGTLWLTLIAVALADWSAMGIKALVDRERPSMHYAEPKVLVPAPHDASFPSGHAATSFAAATLLSIAF